MGAVKKLRPMPVQDLWQREATAAAIASARKMIGNGVQPAQGQYGPKNILLEVLTPDRKGWRRVEQQTNGARPPHQSAMPAPAAEIVRPAWAR